MGIKHIEELSYSEFINVIDEKWHFYEKIDGSSARFIYDSKFTLVVGGKSYTELNQLPDEAWASSYKVAFLVGKFMFAVMKLTPTRGEVDIIDVEMVFNNRPNTIFYSIPDSIVVLDYNVVRGNPAVKSPKSCTNPSRLPSVLKTVVVGYDDKISTDGVDFTEVHRSVSVNILWNDNMGPADMAYRKDRSPRKDIINWLNKESTISGMMIKDVIICPVNKTPSCYSKEEWSSNKDRFKKTRLSYREQLDSMRLSLKSDILDFIEKQGSQYQSQLIEGVVVRATTPFKVVDKKKFTKYNYFTHRVKYLLLGSAFNKKKGLMQIYRDYPCHIKLYHLNRLLEWYKKNHLKIMRYYPEDNIVLGYTDQIHKRTLNMFADTRKRIENGR